jgi:hypothetical protein
MSAYDYSGVDVGPGRSWAKTAWVLFSIGILFASIAAAIVFVHVLVVLRYSQALGQG